MDQALDLLRDMASTKNDPLYLYLEDAAKFPVLNRPKEAELFGRAASALGTLEEILASSRTGLSHFVACAEWARLLVGYVRDCGHGAYAKRE